MAWCEANDVDYVFGLPGNGVLSRLVEIAADDVRVRRAEAQAAVLRRYTETRYGAKSWGCERRVVARIEASTQGLDIRYVVTNLDGGSAARQRRVQNPAHAIHKTHPLATPSPPHASASPLLQHARTTHCFAASPSASSPPDRNTAGARSPHTPGPANIQRRHEPD